MDSICYNFSSSSPHFPITFGKLFVLPLRRSESNQCSPFARALSWHPPLITRSQLGFRLYCQFELLKSPKINYSSSLWQHSPRTNVSKFQSERVRGCEARKLIRFNCFAQRFRIRPVPMPADGTAITIEAIKIGINYQVAGLSRLMTVFRGSKMFRALSRALPQNGSIALILPSFHFANEINSRFLTNPEEMFLQLCSKIHVSSVCFFRCDLWFQKWAHKDNFLLPWNSSLFRSPTTEKQAMKKFV